MSERCRHCSEPIPRMRLNLLEPSCGYCCTGCEAAAAFASEHNDSFNEYNSPEILQTLALQNAEGAHEADVLVEGIRCGACAADIEKRLRGNAGLYSVNVNAHNRIVTLRWNQAQIPFSHILKCIAEGGYQPHPLPLDAGLGDLRSDDRRAMLRLGLAGLGTMQVMMLSLGLYLGPEYGLSGDIRQLLVWASMLLATPVILYAGQPFFSGAFNDLRHWRVGMDVPVALAVAAAFTMSVVHAINGQGEIWFDSACMFVFFLSLGRHMEASGRRRAQQGLQALVAVQPQNVTVVDGDTTRVIPTDKLKVGMTLLARPGETIAADGVVLHGTSQVDESLLTGESTPLNRGANSEVLAGSVNLDQALEIRADKVGADTTRAHLLRLLRRAETRKPATARIADRVAGHFVLAVLAIASITALVWAQLDPNRAFEITLAVLVVTCPCALSLATPASMSAAAAALARKGLLVTRSHTLETLANITDVVFDKTGTLTESTLEVDEVIASSHWTREHILAMAARMERDHTHPIAEALRAYTPDQCKPLKTRWEAGRGISAIMGGRLYELGSPTLLLGYTSTRPYEGSHSQHTWLVLTEDENPIGWVGLRAGIRPEARQAIADLKEANLQIHLMSGDDNEAVADVALQLQIENAKGRMLPDDKLDAVEKLRENGASVLMVGDGLNDAPVLAGADVSIAMHAGAALAQASADAVLLTGNLLALNEARTLALKARRILRQNMSWAIAYNALALPLAVTGLLTPWLAALGMSLSSMLVVGNALRLLRSSKNKRATSPKSHDGKNQANPSFRQTEHYPSLSFRLSEQSERLDESQPLISLHSLRSVEMTKTLPKTGTPS